MKKVVLVGGGHSHLYGLKKLEQEGHDLDVTVVSPSQFQYYSGMFSGFTEGFYSAEDVRVDLQKMCSKVNATFIEAAVISIDPISQHVLCTDGSMHFFDIISFDIGSKTEHPSDYHKWLVPIKPNYLFSNSMEDFRQSANPVIVGGGASGVELSLSILAWRQKHSYGRNVTLISSSPLLSSNGKRTSQKIEEIAEQKGLTILKEDYVEKMNEHTLVTKNAHEIPHSNVLWLTGAKAPGLFRSAGLAVDGDSFLLVEDTLQHVDFPYIFGAGDCVTVKNYPNLPKNGVYAVRQGPILWENILRYASGLACKTFSPQRNFLSILSTGNKEALLTYGNLSIHGKLAWKLKHKIDTSFMKKYKH
ncbi:FAD-dependent oxidoreductase [Bacillus timonensis]|nr:FAD-dependent oxidoreductase [Bacillus timonensis]